MFVLCTDKLGLIYDRESEMQWNFEQVEVKKVSVARSSEDITFKLLGRGSRTSDEKLTKKNLGLPVSFVFTWHGDEMRFEHDAPSVKSKV